MQLAMAKTDSTLDDHLYSLVEPICRVHGVELVNASYKPGRGGGIVRILIDREVRGEDLGSGVSLADCTGVSRDVSSALDVHEDLITSTYRLEVGSPGLERPLFKLADFERFAGKEIKLKTHLAINNRRRFRGELRGVVDGQVQLEQDGETISIPFDEVAEANLVYRF